MCAYSAVCNYLDTGTIYLLLVVYSSSGPRVDKWQTPEAVKSLESRLDIESFLLPALRK